MLLLSAPCRLFSGNLRTYLPTLPTIQMENVSNFLKACRSVGVAEYSLFETVDLYEGKDIGLVVRCLVSLAWVDGWR